ncbi:hypothetical protein CCP2SC5_410012 [Azospirillaceae bacterium]
MDDRFANKEGGRAPLIIPHDQGHSPWTPLIFDLRCPCPSPPRNTTHPK